MPGQTRTSQLSEGVFVCLANVLQHFSSQWFLVSQGTGIIALIIHQLDYQFGALKTLSAIVWVYTIVLLVTFTSLYTLSILLFPKDAARRLRTSVVETACLAGISITFTTILQMIPPAVVRSWGDSWGIVAFVLWWVNTAMTVVCCMGLPYVHVKLQSSAADAVSPAIMLPLIGALTSAACGGIICRYGAISARLQVPVIVVSYLEVGVAIPMAIVFDGIILCRHFNGSYLSAGQVYQYMLPCGPFGQGSFAMQILGQAVIRGSFAGYGRGSILTAEAATPIAFASQFAGLVTWGYATFWWCFAIISIIHTQLSKPGGWKKSEFTMSAWSLVYPWGVYTNAAAELGVLLDSPAFKVWSTASFLMLLLIWVLTIY